MNESVSVDVALTHAYISEISFYYMCESGGLNVGCLENIIVRFKTVIYSTITQITLLFFFQWSPYIRTNWTVVLFRPICNE